MFYLYRGFFQPFQSRLLEHADYHTFPENHTEILVRPFLLFGLFGYKLDGHKFLKAKLRYSLGGVNAGFSKCTIFQIFKEVTF